MNKRRKIFESGDVTNNPDFIDRFLADAGSRQVLGGVAPMDVHLGAAPRSVKVAARATRLSDNVKMEPPDTFSLSPPPDLRGIRTVTVTPISPQHTGGGIMFQNIPQLPPPHPSIQTPHLQQQLYFAQRTMVDVSRQSPQAQYYQMSPGMSVDANRASFPPGNTRVSTLHQPNVSELLPTASVEPNLQLIQPATMPLFQTFNTPKPPEEVGETLPDLGLINSSELNVDSVNNLSASLSCSLNLGDVSLSLNPLDKKPPDEEYKRSLNTPNAENFFANIPNP